MISHGQTGEPGELAATTGESWEPQKTRSRVERGGLRILVLLFANVRAPWSKRTRSRWSSTSVCTVGSSASWPFFVREHPEFDEDLLNAAKEMREFPRLFG